jgi:hypothetical protein
METENALRPQSLFSKHGGYMVFKLRGLAILVGVLLAGNIYLYASDSTDAGSSETTVEKNNDVSNNVNAASDIVYKPIGYGALEIGQIASGHFRKPTQPLEKISHIWQQREYAWLGFNTLVKNKLEINLAFGQMVAYSTPQVGSEPQTIQKRSLVFLKMANASYPIVDKKDILLNAQVGYFPYKYNPDVRNLGEYLFRTNAYPLLVYSDFDYPQADILGLRVNCKVNTLSPLFDFENDLLLHSELYTVPVQNWSLSDVFSVRYMQALTVGGGISFSNLFSVYQGEYGRNWTDPNFDLKTYNLYLKNPEGTDSALFDWKSIKLMGRISFDFKKIIPLDCFGKNDCILYSEADIIGAKNYPEYFTNINDRTFYTLGVNLPGFKIIDVINGEIEYCGDTSAFSDEGLSGGVIPRITPSYINTSSSTNVKRNQLRLSVYVKKSILDGHVSFIAQCARDHKKVDFYYYLRTHMSFMETLPSTEDWWWSFKTEFKF